MSIIDKIKIWEDIVEECIASYNDTIFELDYDLIVRKDIDFYFKNENLYDDFFMEKLNEIDLKFKNLLIFLDEKSDLSFWERKFILKYGSKLYAQSVYETHKIKIDVF